MAIEGSITLLSSNGLVQELEDTLLKPKLEKYVIQSGKTPSELLAEYARLVTLVEPASLPEDAVRDPDDALVLAAAVGGKASHIVTGDEDLLTLKAYAGIPILNAREFVESLTLPDE